MRKLVLLGAGYGNMRILLRLLNKELPEHIDITLIDRTPFHSLKTEFYAIAAGTVPDSAVRVSLPDDVRLTFIEGEVDKIETEQQIVQLADGQKCHTTS